MQITVVQMLRKCDVSITEELSSMKISKVLSWQMYFHRLFQPTLSKVHWHRPVTPAILMITPHYLLFSRQESAPSVFVRF